MKRIAFFGPVAPSRTGIADYDEALLPLLQRHYEIDVFTENRRAVTPAPEKIWEIFPHSEFYLKHRERPYDLTLYQLGNSLFHEYMYGYLFQFPGAVVFHDHVLHHSRAPMLLGRNLKNEYLEELRYSYRLWEKIASVVIPGKTADLLFFYFPLFLLPLRASLAAAAHTDFIVRKLSDTETPILKIPHIRLPGALEGGENLFPGKFVIASFGYATQAKRHEVAIRLIAYLRNFYPNLLYLVAGEVPSRYGLDTKILQFGYQDFVHITGRLEMTEFLQLMARADVVLNLRYPTAGEMSGTLIRALSAGKPTIITRLQHLQEIPSDAALRVRPDFEEQDLYAHFVRLIEDQDFRKRLGTAARKYIEQNHSNDQVVDKYIELIELAFSRKAGFRAPELPLHLRSGKAIMREYIRRTSFQGKESTLLEQLLKEMDYCSSVSDSSSGV